MLAFLEKCAAGTALWKLGPRHGIELAGPIPNGCGVYLFVVQEEIVYVGASVSFRKRMGNYRRGDKSRRRVRQLIEDMLSRGKEVRTLFLQPPDSQWKGLPVITFHGLEAGLIKHLSPPWNIQGKG